MFIPVGGKTVPAGRLLLTLFLTVALTAGFGARAPAQARPGTVAVFLDGLPVNFDVQPVIRNNRTLVPFRAVAEALNVKVAWDGATRTVSAADGKNCIRLQIGNRIAYRNGTPIVLETPATILAGRTLVPLRFFGEAFGCKVAWDGAACRALITSPRKQMTVVGFYALGDSQTSSWTNLFGRPYPETATGNTDAVDVLALGWYSLDAEGNLLARSRTGWQRPDGWEKVLEAAEAYGLKTEMVVHVTDEDGTITSLLNDEAAMNRAVRAIVHEADLYHGVNLDFEGLGWQDRGEQLAAVRDRFTGLVRILSEQLKAAGRTLTLTLHAPNSVYRGYDYKALGALADRIIVMAYDYGSTPEPVDMVLQAVEMARADVPAARLVLGISVPRETPESILVKVGIAKRYGLDGIALWRLGLITDEMWAALRAAVAPRKAGAF